MLGKNFKTASMNHLKETKVSDETQETNRSQNLSRDQFLVHSPETVPREDQGGDDSKNRDSLSEPECLEEDNHPLSAVSESSSTESPQEDFFLGSPVLDTGKKSDLQELVEFYRGRNYRGLLDNILKCHNPNNARSPSPGLQSVSADHSEKENSGNLESDLDGISASHILTTDGSLSSGCQSLHSDDSKKEQEHTDDLEAAGHSPCVLSSPKSEILEMEAKYEMEEFCLSSQDDNTSDEAGWENLKQNPSIGGGSPSTELESDEDSLSEKEQDHTDDLEAAGHSPGVLSSPKSEILEMEEFCLSSHDDNTSDEAGWENLKRNLSIGGGSPSSELESDEDSLSEKEQEHTDDLEAAGHSPYVLSKSGILEMEAKYEIEEFCLTNYDDNTNDEAGWENLKRNPSIGGSSPSPELESDEDNLSEKEQKETNEHLAAASQIHHCDVPLVASSEAANYSESQILGMIKQLKLENKVEEEFSLSDSDSSDDGVVDRAHILDSASNSKTSTPNRSASVGLGPVCSNPSEQEQEQKDDLTTAPVNDDRNVSSVAPSQAACGTAESHHLPEKTDSITKVESGKDLDASLEKNDEASQRTSLLLTDSSSTCIESTLEGRLTVTTKMKNTNLQGSEITDEFSEFSESSDFSEFSESSTSEFSIYNVQQSALFKKLSSILDSATFQELLRVIDAYVISLQKKKDHCQKLTAKLREAEKENEKMTRLLKDSNYESSYLKQMIRRLEVQYNFKVNKTINDESTYQSIKLENNKLIFNSRNQQNLFQEQVCIQKEINEEKHSSMKDLQKQLAGLREELELPHVYCNDEKAQQENIKILKEKLEDTHHDLILNARIMKDVCSYDNKMPTLKSDLAAMAACLENERKSHEMIKKELESTHLCLSEAKKEADLLQGKLRLENQHLKEELKESKDLSMKLATAVSHAKDKENKISRISKELKDTTLQLEKLQWEKDQAVARSQELQTSLHQCREQIDLNSINNKTIEQKIQDLQEENNKLKTNFRKVQQELQEALHYNSLNRSTLKNTISLQKAMKQEKAELIKKLDRLKRDLDSETKRANQNKEEKEWLDLQLKEELLKNTKYHRTSWKLHSLTKSTSKMLQDQRINEAEMAEMKEVVSQLHAQLKKERGNCTQLEIHGNHLQEELDQQLRRNNMLKDELYLQRKRNEADSQTFQLKLQAEKRRFLSQSEALEEKQAFRETAVKYEQDMQKLKKELLMLNKSLQSSVADAKRYQKLYNDETRHSMELASQLRMAQLQFQISSYP